MAWLLLVVPNSIRRVSKQLGAADTEGDSRRSVLVEPGRGRLGTAVTHVHCLSNDVGRSAVRHPEAGGLR
jgi:hypothetical protein